METFLASVTTGMTAMRTTAEVDAILTDARPWLYRLALAITAESDRAEDATQEALVRAMRSRSKLRSVTEPRAWLRTVLTRCALSTLNKKASKSLDNLIESHDLSSDFAVRETLRRLPPLDRVVLALVHFEGLSYAETAEILEIPVGTVGSRLHSARAAFREEWEK